MIAISHCQVAQAASLRSVDLVVLVCYLAGVVGLGLCLVRRSRNVEGFTTGGRSMAGWVVGLSIFGTYVSSISFLANPGKSYSGNWNPFVFGLAIPLAAWIATKWFVPFYRKGGVVSAYAHLEQRFGLWARHYAGACFVLMQLGRIGTILYLVALAVAPLTGWSVPAIIVLTGLLVIAYTMLGGIEAVIWTDVVQSVVLFVGILFALGLLLLGEPEVGHHLRENALEKMSLGSFGFDFTESTFWVVLIFGIFINLNNFGIDQTYVQRFIAAKTDRAARQSVWLGGLLYLPVSALLFLVGTALFSYYAVHGERLPGELAAELAQGEGGDKVFPHFIATEMPAGVTGLLVAAVLAAAMSSVDSSLNSSSTLVLEDFVKRVRRSPLSASGQMWILYASTAVMGLLGIGAALLMMDAKSALDSWWKIAGIFSGAVLGLFLLGFLSRRATQQIAASAVACGVGVICFLTFSPLNQLHSFLTIVLGTSAIVLIGFVATAVASRFASE